MASEDKQEWRGERSQSQLFLDLFNSREKFSEPVDPGNLLLCLGQRDGRASPPCPAADVLGNTTLRTDGGVIANLDMPNDTSLTANQDTLTDPHTAGNSGLRCDDGILADHNVVCDLHEIVDLCSLLDPGSAKTGAIDGRVGADLDIIVDLNDPELLNFFLAAIDHLESKSVSTNDRAAVDDHTRADAGAFTDRHSWINQARRSNDRFMTNVSPCTDDCAVTDPCPGFDHRVRLDRDALSELDAWIDNRAWVNARRKRDRFWRKLEHDLLESFRWI